MRYGLTHKQRKAFRWIEGYINQYVEAPTQAEIRKALDIESKNIQPQLNELQRRGWIDWIPKAPRSIIILPDTTEYFPNQYNPTKVNNT